MFFVAGKFTMSGGGTVYNSGIIAAGGIITISGGGGYNNTGDSTTTGLFGFAANSKAIVLSGGSSAPLHGVAYAPNGGIELSGGSNWNGMLISGGSRDARQDHHVGRFEAHLPGRLLRHGPLASLPSRQARHFDHGGDPDRAP